MIRGIGPCAWLVSLMLIATIGNQQTLCQANIDEVGKWLAGLRDPDATARRRAAYRLKEIGRDPKVAVAQLTKGLTDPSPYVRRYCACALGELRLEPELAVPALALALRDPEEDVRAHAAIALIKLGLPAVPALVDTLRYTDVDVNQAGPAEPSALRRASPGLDWLILLTKTETELKDKPSKRPVPVSDYAAFALSRIGKASVPALLGAFKEENVAVHRYALAILQQIDVPQSEALPVLIQSMNSDNRKAQLSAIETIVSLYSEAYPYSYFDQAERPSGATMSKMGLAVTAALPVLVTLIKQGDKEQQKKAAFLLRKIGTGAIPTLAELLRDGQDDIRLLAVEALTGMRPGPSTVRQHLLIALKDTNLKVRLQAAKFLRWGAPEDRQLAITVLVEFVEDADAGARQTAIAALGSVKESSRYSPVLIKESSRYLPALIKALKDHEPEIRITAIKALVADDKSAQSVVPALVETLTDPDEKVRSEAASALGRAGRLAQAAVPHLSKALEDPDRQVRRQAAEALKMIGSDAAVPALIEALKDPDEAVRVSIASAFSKLGRSNDAAFHVLIGLMKDGSEQVRIAAVEGLGTIGPRAKDAIGPLIEAFEDSSLNIPGYTVSAALAKIGPSAVAPLLKAMSEGKYLTQVSAALKGMGPAPVDALVRAMEGGNEAVRAGVVGILTREEFFWLAEPKKNLIRSALIAALKDPSPRVRQQAAAAFAGLVTSVPASVPALIEALNDTDAGVRQAAAQTLGEMREEAQAAIASLKRLLSDASPNVARAAASALLRIDTEPLAAPVLVDLLAGGDSLASRALKEMGQAAVPALIKALDDPAVRHIVLQLLSGPKAKAAVPALIGLLKDPAPSIRRGAAEALERIGPAARSAGPALIKALEDEDDKVQFAAAKALVQIGYNLREAGPLFITVINDNFVRDQVAAALRVPLARISESEALYRRDLRNYGYRTDPFHVPARPPDLGGLPAFTWPPPPFSAYNVINSDLLGAESNRLQAIYDRLDRVLNNAGFSDSGLYQIPGGFAIATRVERIQQDGKPYGGDDRWTNGKLPLRSWNPIEWLERLGSEPPGQWRLFVFMVTTLDTIAADEKPLSETEARRVYLRGGRILPASLAGQPFKGYKCHVLIYQLEKKLMECALPLPESRWSVEAQLQQAGLHF